MLLRNIYSVLVSALLAVIVSLGLNQLTRLDSETWFYALLFFGTSSFILNFILAFYSEAVSFTRALFVGITIRLILAFTAVLVYSMLDGKGFFNFSMHFILHFVLFTIFEIRYLLFIIRKKIRAIKNEN